MKSGKSLAGSIIISFAAVALLLITSIVIYECTADSPTEPNQRVLGVSELLGALIAIVGVPLLFIQLWQLRGGLLTACQARGLIESDLRQKENELKKKMLGWFPEGSSREPGDFEVRIYLDPKWPEVIEDWLPEARDKDMDWPRDKNYRCIEIKKQKRDAIRTQQGKAWVVCSSKSGRRFTKEDAETLENKLKSPDASGVIGSFEIHDKLREKFQLTVN
jgi:hypothetical protein